MGASPKPLLSRFQMTGWLVDREACCLIRAGEEFHFRPMLVELLASLAERDGQVVTKDDILDHIWSSRFVSEPALTTKNRGLM